MNYQVNWHIFLVGTMRIKAKTFNEALDIAERELHHNPNFLTNQVYAEEADITEVLEDSMNKLKP